MQEKRINWKPYIIAAIISFIIGVTVFLVFFFALKSALVDAFAFGAVFLISAALLMWVAREGFFDLFSYGFKQLGSMMFSKKPSQYNDYPGYKEYKYEIREKREKIFLSVGAVGLVELIVTVIIYLVSRL